MMRKVVIGMVMAGMLLPGLASAQEEGHPRKWADQRENPPIEGEQQGHRPQQQPRPQNQPQQQRPEQQQAEQQRGSQVGGPDRADRGNRGGDPRGFRPQPGAAEGAGQRDARDYGGRDRFAPGRPFGDRFDRSPPGNPGHPGNPGNPGNPGANGFRPQGGLPVAPGSGGYRPQPGQPGFGGSGYGRPAYGQPAYGQSGHDRGRPGEPGFRPAPPPPGRGGAWNRGWRDDRRFDFRQYRTQNNYIFRLPRYQAPRGWGYGYRRFTPGLTLSAVLFDQDFWIDDPFYYRLPPAYGPYRWVRYYNDALLVDLRSGEVVDTVYDLFW